MKCFEHNAYDLYMYAGECPLCVTAERDALKKERDALRAEVKSACQALQDEQCLTESDKCEGIFAGGDARHATGTAQRKSARAEGWTRRGKRDLCPECSKSEGEVYGRTNRE